MTSTVAGEPGLRDRLHGAVRKAVVGLRIEQLNIRWRFRLVVMAFGLPFIAYIVWSAAAQAMLEKEHARNRAKTNATLVAARFEDEIEQVDRLLATLSQTVGANVTDVAGNTRLLRGMRGNVPTAVDNIGVWSASGDIVASLDRRSALLAVNIGDRDYFRRAVVQRELVHEGPLMSRSTGAEVIQFARPIFGVKNDVTGVITMSIRTDRLIADLDRDALISSGALVTIISTDGRIVARSSEAESPAGKNVVRTLLDAIFATDVNAGEEVGIDGERRLFGYAVVTKRPWIVMVGEPLDKVIAPIIDRLLQNFGIGLAIFGLVLLIAGRVAAWTVGPLMQLAADAERVGRGQLSHRSAVAAGGEIGTLAANFNRMAEAIEQRDIALATSRTQLRTIADNVPELITYVDADERYRFVNACPDPLQNRFSAEAMIGMTIREVRGDAIYETILPGFRRAMSGEANASERSVMIGGRICHFHVTYVPDYDANKVVGVFGFLQDITERKTAELARAESEKRLIMITDNVPAIICYIDENRCFRFGNRAFERWYRQPLAELIGLPFDRLMPPAVASQYDYYFLRGMRGESVECELEIPSKSQGTRWLQCSFIPDIEEASGRVLGVYGMAHNVTKAKESEQRLTRLAQFDTLTGLANRHQFNETFASVLARNALGNEPLALMFLDIDHFKEVNDRHGHGGGDLLLKEFSMRLLDCVRPTDVVARLAGDEFVVLLDRVHSDDEPQFVARKIIAAIEKPFFIEHVVVRVGASIGIAMRAGVDEPSSVLMKRADEALYEAKRAGRNTFRMAG